MSYKLGKNILRLIDSVNTGLLTINKILTSKNNLGGIENTNIYIDEIIKDSLKKTSKKTDDQIIIKNKNVEKEKHNLTSGEIKIKKDSTDINENSKEELKIKNSRINNLKFEKELENKANVNVLNITPVQTSNISNASTLTSTPEKEKEDDSFFLKSDKTKFVGKASKIPTSSFSRAMNFGLLGLSVVTNSLSLMALDKMSNSEDKNFSSYLVNETNAERLSRTLCKMRGAALKLGQILSTFEDLVIPEPIKVALERARAEANIMPKSQLVKILKAEYGKNWKAKFIEFNDQPFAAASIGQVHQATINDGTKIAVKVQYPGVAQSIDSDLQNLKRLFEYFKIFPKGMYIDDLVKNLGNELRMECNYIEEAEKQTMFKQLLKNDSFYYVPKVIPSYSTNLILCSEFIEGVNVDDLDNFPQEVRDLVGEKILELTLRELFEFKFMQTDPNPANFFYDHANNRINLIDFGAARYFDEGFVDKYMTIVHAAAINDNETIVKFSKEIGFLTGMESKIMLDSHTQATLAVGEPFNINLKDEVFDFSNQNLTRKIYKLLPTMLKHRLKAPPTEIYSLHRKLSGAYLICIKLKSRVRAKKLFFDIYDMFYKNRLEFINLNKL